jgi:hypothetical protein
VAESVGIGKALRDYASADLESVVAAGRVDAKSPAQPSASLQGDASDASRAMKVLAHDAPEASFVLRSGRLTARLGVGSYIYYAPIGDDGKVNLEQVERVSAILSRWRR